MFYFKKNKKAFTLVETLVAIAIFLLGIQATVLLFSKSWQSQAYSIEMGKASFIASQGISNLVKYIRGAKQSDSGAFAIVFADKNEIIFYSDYDKDNITERLHVYLLDNKILMGVTKPTATLPKTYPSGDQQTIEIANHIVNFETDSLFSYYNKDYPADLVNNPVDVPADVSQIRLVKIFIRININPNRAPDNIHQESFVEIRNLNDYDRIY